MRPNVDPQDAAAGGVWYEPRSLWYVKGITLSEYEIPGATGPTDFGTGLTVQLPRNPFRNGTRFPIQINRIAISAVGYPLARPDVAAMQDESPGPADLNGTSVINRLKFNIAAPYRKNYTRTLAIGTGLTPRPTAEPPTGDGTSSLWGTTTLRYDKPLIVPKNGYIEWDLSSIQGMRWLAGAGGTAAAFNLNAADMPLVMSYLEAAVDSRGRTPGGVFPGNARSCASVIRTNLATTTPVPGNDGYPYLLPPGFGPSTAGGASVPFWDPQASFDGPTYRRQNVTRAGSTNCYGMTCAIDQRVFDAAVLEEFPQAVIAPVSTRLGSRIRLLGMPSNSYWWTPGAPLALVLDTVTPAAVYWLDEPITLEPGDTFEISLTVPAPSPEAAFQSLYANAYQYGISLNGFTAISG